MIKKVTIQQIAKELDLSRNTVAKALINSDTVAYDTRMTVIRKAWEMGYQKMSASVLEEYKLVDPSQQNRNVIIMVRRELSVFWNSIIVGISDELDKNGCRMSLCFISSENERNLVFPRELQEDAYGIILMSVFDPKYTEKILEHGIPTVFLDCPIGYYAIPNNCDVVLVEGRKSVQNITSTLIRQGLKNIGFIGDTTYCESFKQRYEGYCDAMTANGRTIDSGIVCTKHLLGSYSENEVDDVINAMIPLPDAIVCANDDIALKAHRALKKRGFSIPRDIALTGFDNEEILVQVEPMLTTVSVHNQMLGKRLVQQLLWRRANPDFPKELVSISSEVIFRHSSEKYD